MPSVSLSVDLLGLASLLIAFNTEAPPGNEGPCARFVANYLSDLHIDGADIEVHSFARDRSNVVATFGSGAPGLLLAGHIDVVPVKDASAWSSPPYEANIRGGRMYGRGSADMKSGLAAMLAAISSAKGRKLKRSLSLVATAGEEVGFDGLDALVREGRLKRIKARCGVVGEPAEMKVVRAHRGGLTCQVAFEGRSAHAGDPSLGVNSIENCGRFLTALGPARRRLSATRDPDLGRTIVTPTMISGGTKSNVIPGACELTLDSRLIPAVGSKAVLKELDTVILALSRKDRSFKAKVQVLYETPALSVPRDAEVVRLSESLTGSTSGVAPYGTEAPVYCGLGTPTVVLGPGSVRQAHIVDEYAQVRQIKSAERVYRRMIETVCL
jgi:acetylornithine deacetylase ArgE